MNRTIISLSLLAVFVAFATGMAQAKDIPGGTVTSTITITQDSRLVGDLSCTLTGAPCIQFGAPGITLYLNGHIMTGNGGRTSCTFTDHEDGINTNLQNAVSIEGPGMVRRFNHRGIDVTGSESEVEGVVVASSCVEGIVAEGSRNLIDSNSVTRSSLVGGLNFNAAIWVQGTGQHVIRNNEVGGQGNLNLTSGPPFAADGAQGIFVGHDTGGTQPSKDNLIIGNSITGTPGSGIFVTLNSTGNKIIGNQALGNVIFNDIFDANAVGGNLYINNLCEVSFVGAGTNVCKVSNIAGHGSPNPGDE